MIARLSFIHTISPMHIGSGNADVGVERAVARSPVTGFPVIPGSGLKGALRAAARTHVAELFGSAPKDPAPHAGAVTFHDAPVLCLPVRTFAGAFAWITCPMALRLHRRDANLFCGFAAPEVPDVPKGVAYVSKTVPRAGDGTIIKTTLGNRNVVVLEDFVLNAQEWDLSAWAKWIGDVVFPGEIDKLEERLCVVNDEIMAYLCRHSLGVDARNSLDPNKAVRHFWHEESVPSESIFAGILSVVPLPGQSATTLVDALKDNIPDLLQLGGNETVGRGASRVLLS